MKPIHFLPLLAIAVLAVLAVPSGESDASGYFNIHGHVVLEENTVYPDKSIITISPFTSIELGDHTLDFGAGSDVIVAGDVTVSSGNGRLVFGQKSVITVNAIVLPVLEEGATVSFSGTLCTDVTLRGSEIFLENAGDNRITVAHGNTVTEFNDAKVSLSPDHLGFRYALSFSTIVKTVTDSSVGQVISVKRTVAEAGSKSETIALRFSLHGFQIVKFDIARIASTDTYKLSGVVSETIIDGIQPLSITSSGGIRTLDAAADSILIERKIKGELDQRILITDPELRIDLDAEAWRKVLDPSFDPTKPLQVFKSVDFEAPEATIEGHGEQRRITNLFADLEAQKNGYYRFEAGFDEGDAKARLVAATIKLASFSISRDLVANLSLVIDDLSVTYDDPQKGRYGTKMKDVLLDAIGFNIMNLYRSYARSGTIGPQEILDSCSRFDMSSVTAHVTTSGEHPLEADIAALKVVLMKDTRDINTMTIGAESVAAATVHGDSDVDAHMENITAYLSSTGSMTEVVDALLSRVHFTTDSSTDLEIGISKATVVMTDDDTVTRITADRASASAPKQAACTAQLTYSTYSDTTTLSMNISLLGYSLAAQIDRTYSDPVGKLALKASGRDISGVATLSFGEGIGYSANLYVPWSLDVDYYGIDVEADGKDSALSITRGTLAVNGYDYRDSGILRIVPALHNRDFDTSMRVSLGDSLLKVYKDHRETEYNTYRDIDIGIKEVVLGIHPDRPPAISLDRIEIELVDGEGKERHREIHHLDIANEDDGPDFLSDYAEILLYILTAAIIAMVAALVYLRIKKPHLFKLNEADDGEITETDAQDGTD